ncbi:SAM-dependent methyltransferase [Salinifilum aidingensis]
MSDSWVPDGIDFNQPSPARMYDYYLGGAHNFEVDRKAAERAIATMPFTETGAQVNRAWLGRAVRDLVARGVRQFLDLGSGVPTVGNVHEIAQRDEPSCRVVYVDIDPVATAHASRMLAGNPLAGVVRADMCDVDAVLDGASAHLDWNRPVALLVSAVLHFVPDERRPGDVLARYRERMVPGSYLALSHMSRSGLPPEEVAQFTDVYRSTARPVVLRERDEIEPLLAGFTPVEPGLVRVPLWHPEREPAPADEDFPGFAVVARKDG